MRRIRRFDLVEIRRRNDRSYRLTITHDEGTRAQTLGRIHGIETMRRQISQRNAELLHHGLHT